MNATAPAKPATIGTMPESTDIQDSDGRRPRLSSVDWEREALALIAEEGVGALAIDPLARRLGVTKGSFYWHFKSRDALLEAALHRWEEHSGRQILEDVAGLSDPRQRLRQLILRVANEVQSTKVHAAMLRAMELPRVRLAIDRTARRHIEILAEAYRQTGMAEPAASRRARLAYAAYVGFLQLASSPGSQRLDHEEFDAYVEHVIETLAPA